MKTLILPFSENNVDILNFINSLRRQKKYFGLKLQNTLTTIQTLSWSFLSPTMIGKN